MEIPPHNEVLAEAAIKDFREGRSIPGDVYLNQVQCDHANMTFERDGEYHRENCPDCGYTYECEDRL